jgi:hypothetical protein
MAALAPMPSVAILIRSISAKAALRSVVALTCR